MIDKISSELKKFGLRINWIEGEHDGFDEYEIIKIE